MKKFAVLFVVLLMAFSVFGKFNVGILIPGEIGGNPIYELVASGAQKAERAGIRVKLVEGGYNPGKWEPLLRSMAASKRYDLIITLTEGMPESVKKVATEFPGQKFALVDGVLDISMNNVYSIGFYDEEMAFLAGIFAGLVTRSELLGANPELVVGLIAGDTYPAMMNKMKPAYESGVRLVTPNARVIFSVAGSWADPTKGRELASKQFDEGVDIILSIAGGTGIGVIDEAARRNAYVIGVDSNIIGFKPGTILACSLKHVDSVVYDIIMKASKDQLAFGQNLRAGISEGVIDFTFDDENYEKYVPKWIQEVMRAYYILLKYSLIKPLEE
ncbi:BMP family ABC transporter substrate-binding protein [Kosmotoga pacifica]|uniref:Membrane protein n=1 Tax=Kosmotoga pacifica TaxID=1330330 RepID=A0A0G2ZEY9_9BACT|nr:BMP family ABC transporter substrate-binding protein [Kosmotoga pacifica]AKI98114.1 membrane protein [Kosmotoga pacifica]